MLPCLPCAAAAVAAGPPGWALMAATGGVAYAASGPSRQRRSSATYGRGVAAEASAPSSRTAGFTYTSAWSDPDFAALAAAANRLGMNPADLLLVLASESGLQPSARNPSGSATPIAVGLNQITSVADGMLGLTEEDRWALPNKSVAEQIPYVEKFFRGAASAYGIGGYPNAGTVYLANFAPARMGRGTSDDTVIYDTSDGAAYTLNAAFDTDKKGSITIGDLNARLAQVAAQPTYDEALARLQEVTGNPRGPNLSDAGALLSSRSKTVLVAALAAGSAYVLGAPLAVVLGLPVAVLLIDSRK